MYCKELKPSTSRSIACRIVGGQDLRSGDPFGDEHPSRLNCCVPCLERHRYHAETVQHVCFDCASNADLRCTKCIAGALAERNTNICCLHRELWSWRQLEALSTFFVQVVKRRIALAGASSSRTRLALQEAADSRWPFRPIILVTFRL